MFCVDVNKVMGYTTGATVYLEVSGTRYPIQTVYSKSGAKELVSTWGKNAQALSLPLVVADEAQAYAATAK
jgi:hypothetical protein